MDLSSSPTKVLDDTMNDVLEDSWGDLYSSPADSSQEDRSESQEEKKESPSFSFPNCSPNDFPKCSFKFVDSNGSPFSPEFLSFFSRLRIVYVNAIVAANSSSDNVQESFSNAQGRTRQSRKHLLLFSEVGALTEPNTLGKVKLITVNTKPNQLLMAPNSTGEEQIIKLSTPTTSKLMDSKSESVQQLLAQKPGPIPVKNDYQSFFGKKDKTEIYSANLQYQENAYEKYVVPVRHEVSNDLIYKAKVGGIRHEGDINTYQLVVCKDDQVICQKFIPLPNVEAYLNQTMANSLSSNNETESSSPQQSDLNDDFDMRQFRSRVEDMFLEKHVPLERTVKTNGVKSNHSQSFVRQNESSSANSSGSTVAAEVNVKPRGRRRKQLHHPDLFKKEDVDMTEYIHDTLTDSNSELKTESSPMVKELKLPTKRKYFQKQKVEAGKMESNLDQNAQPIRRRRGRPRKSAPNNSQTEKGLDEDQNSSPSYLNPISLVLLAAQNIEEQNNNLELLAEVASERLTVI